MVMWQFWLILSGIFLLIEIFNVSFLIFWFSLGALVAMLASFVINSVIIQATIFLVVSTILLFVTKPFVNKILPKDSFIKTNSNSIEGKIGKVIVDIEPVEGKGQVKISGETWSAKSADSTYISKDTEIVVEKIEGVKEDVMNIVLNIKNLVVKNHSTEKKIMRLSASSEGPVTAGMIERDADIEIVNPDLVICNLVKGGKIDIEMTVENGRGYVDAKENKKTIGETVGLIPIDSIYSPVEKVAFEVENARVGHNENYDKLIMYVYTNGSITPEECMALASRILIEHLNIVADLNQIADITGIIAEKKVDTITKTLETPIEEIEFSVRAYNCLKRAGIHTMQDLIDKREVEVTKIRNLGKKSLKEVIDKVNEMGLKFRD